MGRICSVVRGNAFCSLSPGAGNCFLGTLSTRAKGTQGLRDTGRGWEAWRDAAEREKSFQWSDRISEGEALQCSGSVGMRCWVSYRWCVTQGATDLCEAKRQ